MVGVGGPCRLDLREGLVGVDVARASAVLQLCEGVVHRNGGCIFGMSVRLETGRMAGGTIWHQAGLGIGNLFIVLLVATGATRHTSRGCVGHIGGRSVDIGQDRRPRICGVANRAIARGDEVAGALVINQCASDTELVRAIMAGGACAHCLGVIKLGGHQWSPRREDMAGFAQRGCVQMGRILGLGVLHCAVVAGEAGRCGNDGVCMIKVIDRPRLAASHVAGGAEIG